MFCLLVKIPVIIDYFVTYLLLLSGQDISIEKAGIWETRDKTFETWICHLVYALIYFCDDTILRYTHLSLVISNGYKLRWQADPL